MLLAIGNYSEAEEYFDKALSINPNNFYTFNNIAYELGRYSNNYSKALELVEKSLAINPNYINAMDTKALILIQLGKYPEASTIVR